MSSKIKIGDVVPWSRVPDGVMTRDEQGWHAIRLRGRGIYVGQPDADEPWLSGNPWSDEGRWVWGHVDGGHVKVVALGLTGQESADELRRMAEIFEVLESLRETVEIHVVGWDDVWEQAEQWLAERLHAAGWRPDMTAEDAARLLAGET